VIAVRFQEVRSPFTTRRGFLRLAGSAAAFTALAQLRAVPAAPQPGADAGERFFDPHQTEILSQIAERMVETGDPVAPRLRDTAALATIDGLCRQLDPALTGQLSLALVLFEYGPFLFDFTFSRFSRMSDEHKDASLTAWMTSRLGIRRLAFTALRNLCMLGYYSQPETWDMIGYQGPLLGREATT